MDPVVFALSWPAEMVPDGAVIAGHHFWIGLGIAIYAVYHVGDDHPHREPSIVLGGVLTAVLGFVMWPYQPVAGAILSHVGVVSIAGAVLVGDFMARYAWRGWRGVVLVGLLVTLDDLISHAWGVWTPLDGWVWGGGIVPVLYWLRQLLAV